MSGNDESEYLQHYPVQIGTRNQEIYFTHPHHTQVRAPLRRGPVTVVGSPEGEYELAGSNIHGIYDLSNTRENEVTDDNDVKGKTFTTKMRLSQKQIGCILFLVIMLCICIGVVVGVIFKGDNPPDKPKTDCIDKDKLCSYGTQNCTIVEVQKRCPKLCHICTGSTLCPKMHPYAYLNGKYCCKYNHENVNEGVGGEKCDEGPISLTSVCCKDHQHVQCPGNICDNYDGVT